MKDKIDILKKYSEVAERNDPNLMSLVENSYIEMFYLKKMI